jgi:hypothetical protein
MKIEVEIIDNPLDMRYSTSGDFFYDGDILVFQILRQKTNFNTKMTLLHELAEQILCEEMGIKNEDIDKFDMEWNNPKYQEPGDDPKAPYYEPHLIAKACEYLMLGCLGRSFKEYFKSLI